MTRDGELKQLERLVGTWATRARHPLVPGGEIPGNASFEWLPGRQFLIHRAHLDDRRFPDLIAIIGRMNHDRIDPATGELPAQTGDAGLQMQYFDSRGVHRLYEIAIDATTWRWWRDAPGFAQRFTGTFAADGATISGRSQLCEDGQHWKDDLAIEYRRRN